MGPHEEEAMGKLCAPYSGSPEVWELAGELGEVGGRPSASSTVTLLPLGSWPLSRQPLVETFGISVSQSPGHVCRGT